MDTHIEELERLRQRKIEERNRLDYIIDDLAREIEELKEEKEKKISK